MRVKNEIKLAGLGVLRVEPAENSRKRTMGGNLTYGILRAHC